MAILKYFFFRCVGDRQKKAQAIKNGVKDLGLGMLVPMIKFEPGYRGEFYLGLAIQVGDYSVRALNADDNAKILRLAGLAGLGRPLNPQQLCPAAEVRDTFLRGEIDWESFNEPICFEPPTEPSDDLLEEQTFGEAPVKACIDFDQLLWWVSAMGEGSYGLLKQVIGQMPGFKGMPPWQAARRLTLLGHLEFRDEGPGRLRWGAAPTSFVIPKEGDAFLLGRRTPWLVNRISESISCVETRGQESGPTLVTASPARVVAGKEALGKLAIGVVSNPAIDWASKLPTSIEFEASLATDPDIGEGRYSFKKWDGQAFKECHGLPSGQGLYEVQRLAGSESSTKRYALFNGKRWVVGGYYDLRWLAVKAAEGQPKAFLAVGGDLLVPEVGRFPLAYERAIVLCSGMLPSLAKDGNATFLRYPRVGHEVASALCEKLDIQLVVKNGGMA